MADKTSSCIKEANNWGKLEQKHKFDNKAFDKDAVSDDISITSPKLQELLKNIKDLDDADMKTHKKLFKHFIYSDIKSPYGAKLIASILTSAGFNHGYSLKKTQRGMSFGFHQKSKNYNTFVTLTSTPFFEKPLGVNFRKEIIKRFNSRPDNIYGENIRIIILDSGFREGIDLFDVKYVHLVEPISTPADEKQAIGRATRRCGQKGLTFDSKNGWPLYVYRYETIISDDMKDYLVANDKSYEKSTTFFDLFMKFSNIDPKKIALSNELESIGLDVAVDKHLTSPIHSFDIKLLHPQSGGSHKALEETILKKYGHLRWPDVIVRNECVSLTNEDDDTEQFKNIAKFSPTQEFIRNYFTPKYKNPGMLLWHSVGTGKTCTAIATASSTFEVEGYTILYVTRHTLKSSTWKDMFDNVCSIVVQEYVKKGLPIPKAHAQRLRLISKGWFQPISYRQFSNTLSGKNQLSKELIKRNGKADMLHKTLIIVDEAHKLFASDVEGPEKADINVIKEALMNSSKVSGKDGVKLLLMTATPYTTDAMDLFKLLNLCRPHDDQIPESFEEFSEQYLDETGNFTDKSKVNLYNKIAGYISYLNQGKDIRSFAYPIVKDINVQMSDYSFDRTTIDEINYMKFSLKEMDDDIKNTKKITSENIAQQRKELTEKMAEQLEKLKKEASDCKKDVKFYVKLKEKAIDEQLKFDLHKCDESTENLIEKATVLHNKTITELKQRGDEDIKNAPKGTKKAIKDKLASDVKQLKFDLKYTIEQIKKRPEVIKCKDELRKRAEESKKSINKDDIPDCEKINRELATEKENQRVIKANLIQVLKKDNMMRIKELEQKYKDTLKKRVTLKKELKETIESDKSQRMAIDKCLADTMQPQYKVILNEDAIFNANDMEDIIDEDKNGKKNIYAILGHGVENPIDFDKRYKVPENKVIVVFTTCSKPNYMHIGCNFLEIFNNPKYAKYLANPVKYGDKLTKAIGSSMRIYFPNEYMPDIASDLFVKFHKEKEVVLSKSGVYRINEVPIIDRALLRKPIYNLGTDLCLKWCGSINTPDRYTTKIHSEVFKKNIFKRAKTKTNKYSELSKSVFRILDITNTVGKGIYYYVGCRSTGMDLTKPDLKQLYDNITANSNIQQNASGRNKMINDLFVNINKNDSIISENRKTKSLPPPPPPPQRSNPPSPRLLKNNIYEIERLMEIQDEIYSAKDDSNLKKLEEELDKFTQTNKVLFLKNKINELSTLFNTDKEVLSRIAVVKMKHKGKNYTMLNIIKYIKEKKRNIEFPPVLYGILNNDISDNDNKCTASGIISEVRKLYKKGITINLPKTFEDADSNEVFTQLCKDVRSRL